MHIVTAQQRKILILDGLDGFVLFNDTGLVSERTFGVMNDHTLLNLQITRSDIRPHIKWAVILVIAYGPFNLPPGFVWICMGLTYSLYHPEGNSDVSSVQIK